ncbi:MAG TPA: C2 family cysteine protease [Candidatus Didemnitutus sp.]|nr:C2 family cysteine protease [Candidatus Didemnitutus sp.]
MFSLAAISAAASAVAHSQLFAQTNPPVPDPIGPVVHPGDEVALNPQPLHPRDMLFGAPSHRFDTVALNPQPLPPREALLGDLSHRFDAAALNPQPLPPREALAGLSRRFDTVALNPQPLPPREALLGGPSHRGSIASIRAALEPQLRPTHGLHKALIDALLRDPLAHRRTGKVFSDATLDTPPATTQQLFVKGAGDVDAVSFNDIDQQQVGDCFLLGSLAAVARQDPQRIRDMVVDNGNGTYTVTFKEQRSVGVGLGTHLEWFDVPITVTADFPGGPAGDKHAAPGDTGWGTVEIWPLVIEKAYGQYLTCVDPYGAITKGGSPRTALEMLTGRPVTSDGSLSVGLGGPESFDTLLADFQAGKAITVGTDAKEETLVKDHCYAVSNVYRDANGKQWVELYNPWGHDHATLSFDEVRKREIYTA